MNNIDLTKMRTEELLRLYSAVIETLYKNEIIRTSNNPVADYAEHLVCQTLNLKQEKSSAKGFDAVDSKGKKYEIKARRITPHNKPTRFSAIRQLEARHFDYLVAVLFASDFTVKKASIIPYDTVKQLAFRQDHVNAHIVPISDILWKSYSAIDITDKLNRESKNI